jgi:hypothetical protein
MACLLSGCWLAVHAQEDTLAGMRRFIRVCNSYKQMPLSMNMVIQRKANLITNRGDSSQLVALFCLYTNGSYIYLDGTEQLANDSLLLLVNKPAKRMILYANRQSVADRYRAYMGLRFADSSLHKMAAVYKASTAAIFRDTAVIAMRSRIDLPKTTLPREEVEVRFNANTDEPYEVMEVERNLFPVTKAMYLKAAALPEWSGKTVSAGDSLFFLVKELTTIFRYRNISHDPEGRLPFRVIDRIAAELPGKYRPAKGFTDYVLTQQF